MRREKYKVYYTCKLCKKPFEDNEGGYKSTMLCFACKPIRKVVTKEGTIITVPEGIDQIFSEPIDLSDE